MEDMQILSDINANPEHIFKYILRPDEPGIMEENNSPVMVFIDEIQYLDRPSNFLKFLYDKYLEKLKIVATGSSAFYIDSSFDDSLAGRKRIFNLKTLSFDEYLRFKDKDDMHRELGFIRQQPEYISNQRTEIMELFDEYLVFGGYPAVALENDPDEKIALLKDLKNSFLKSDIEEAGIINSEAFVKLFTILANQTGNLVNKNELSNTIKVDNKTIDHHIVVLQKCFHIGLVKPFFTNIRKELTKMPKVFLLDLGLRNSLIDRFSKFEYREDKGSIFENYVFNRLTELFENDQIRYWRTTDKKEIDFVVTADFATGQAFEAKIDARLKKSDGFFRFKELYPDFSTRLITYNDHNSSTHILKL
jgi:predicted AAA+ superfamily ATPase